MNLRVLDAAGAGVVAAADALEAALLAGVDPESDPARSIVALDDGQLLLMPSAAGGRPVVKLVTIGGDPRIQGVCVVFDGESLAPAALIDGIALTNLRTAAVSLVALRRLAAPEARRLVVFGRGPQAAAHVEAVRAIRPIESVELVGRDRAAQADDLVAGADIVCCCTTAREPLFDGTRVSTHTAVVAIGSHEPGVRELDAALMARAAVVVESRTSALREAGDVVLAIDAGVLSAGALITLGDLVNDRVRLPPDRPRVFKSTGMSWEDAVVAAALAGA